MTRTRFPDPYEGMSADELDRHFSELLTEERQRQRAISIRFPEKLLEDLRHLATQLGIPYQTLIKLLLQQDVARLRAHPPRARHEVAHSPARRRAKPAAGPPAVKHAPPAASKPAAKRRSQRHPHLPT